MDENNQPAVAIEEDAEQAEREALGRIVHAFKEYKTDADWEIRRWEYNYSRLSEPHKDLLNNIPAKIAAAQQCVHQNQLFLRAMLSTLEPGLCPDAFADGNQAAEEWSAKVGGRVSPQDADKVRYVFKNLMRDWSTDGAAERAESYGRITRELKRIFPHVEQANDQTLDQRQDSIELHDNEQQSSAPSVLVPGCGLGRLVAEIAGLGFHAVGCEFSYFMLIASSFVLNHTQRAEQWTLHPWVLNTCNHVSDADQLRPILVPDIEPAELVLGIGSNSGSSGSGSKGSMGMCAGDFAEIFSQPNSRHEFDAVVTCFFIDTANNVIEYLETIWNCLKPGGWWVNIGPLMWHWADSHTYLPDAELSIEISLKDVQRIAQQMGFRFVRQEEAQLPYMSDEKSMLRQEYKGVFWSAQKPLDADADGDGDGS